MDKNISYGVLLFNREGTHGLLVKRKYTYAFFNYVMNTYKVTKRNLMHLFNNMTLQEKRIILQFNYELLWRILWVENDGLSIVLYHKHKKHYDNMIENNKILILDCLSNCQNLPDSECNLWSIPKGRKDSVSEIDIDVARREFEEETSIPPNDYILYTDFRRDCILDNNYKLSYYLARYKRNVDHPIRIKIQKCQPNLQIMEIDGIEWMSMYDISNKCPYLKKHLKPGFNYFKKIYRL